MTISGFAKCIMLFLPWFFLPVALSAAEPAMCEAEVCIYGGTSGGVVAAIQAARLGKPVILVEPGRHLGGMTSGGLSAVDIGDPRSVGRVARLRDNRNRSGWTNTRQAIRKNNDESYQENDNACRFLAVAMCRHSCAR